MGGELQLAGVTRSGRGALTVGEWFGDGIVDM